MGPRAPVLMAAEGNGANPALSTFLPLDFAPECCSKNNSQLKKCEGRRKPYTTTKLEGDKNLSVALDGHTFVRHSWGWSTDRTSLCSITHLALNNLCLWSHHLPLLKLFPSTSYKPRRKQEIISMQFRGADVLQDGEVSQESHS